jgi:hypothetical protein
VSVQKAELAVKNKLDASMTGITSHISKELSKRYSTYTSLLELLYPHNGTKDIGIKLTIVPLKASSTVKSVMKFVGAINVKYGWSHTDLIIGNHTIGWDNSSLCRPRRLSNSAVAVLDIAILSKHENLLEILTSLCMEIAYWNTSVEFNLRKRNSHHFVDACLAAMGMSIEFKGAFKDYIESINKTNSVTATFTPHDILQRYLGISKAPITFNSHAELDEFCYRIIEKVPHFHVEDKYSQIVVRSTLRLFIILDCVTKSI